MNGRRSRFSPLKKTVLLFNSSHFHVNFYLIASHIQSFFFLQLFYFQLFVFIAPVQPSVKVPISMEFFLLEKMATWLHFPFNSITPRSTFRGIFIIQMSWLQFYLIESDRLYCNLHTYLFTQKHYRPAGSFEYYNFVTSPIFFTKIDFFPAISRVKWSSVLPLISLKVSSSWHRSTVPHFDRTKRSAIPGIARRRLAPSFVISTAIRILLTTVSLDRSGVKGLGMERSKSSRTLCIKVEYDSAWVL